MTRQFTPAALSATMVLATGMLLACASPVTQTVTTANPASGARQPVQQLAPQEALQAALTAYAREDVAPLSDMLPARFIGRGFLLEAAQTTLNEQKQIRITLSDVRIQPGTAGGNAATLVAVSARWDKRFLKLPSLVPSVETGTLQAVMRLEAGQWVFDSLSPDNPFVR